MTKEMIISSNGHETMVAILEDDLVAEIFVERERQRGVVGNVYKGRVSKVLPGMQSSFIDIGLERDGFLYVADVDRHDGGVRQARVGRRETAAARGRKRDRRAAAAAEDRGPAQRGPGNHRPGRQGAARHQGRPPHVARHHGGAVPGVHADGRPRRRLPEDRVARGAQPAARHRPRVPRSARVHRRRHHPHRGRRAGPRRTSSATSKRSTRSGPRSASKMESSRAPAVLYREQSLVGKLLRDLLTDDFQAIRIDNAQEHRRVLDLIERIMPNLAPKVKLYSKPLSDLRGVRRPGGDRQGAQEQGLAEVGRIDRHQPDRGARRHRREHGPLRRQEDERTARGHDRQDEPRGGQGDRPADPPARPRRHHRARLHRHGGEEEPPEGAPGGRAGAAERIDRRQRRCRCRISGW